MDEEGATPLSDEQITAFIADPATITTHEIALEVVACLDIEIADIQAQIDAAQIRYASVEMPKDTENWIRRAAYAAAMRRNERHRVMQRDKEIRGTKGVAQTPPEDKRLKREANLLKQQRLLEETQARRLKQQNERDRLQIEREKVAQKRRELEAENLRGRIRELEQQLSSLQPV